MKFYLILLIYYIVITIFGIVLVAYDKLKAVNQSRRIKDRLLLYTALFGGAFGMYMTMLLLRHKTRQRLYMISLPLMIILHLFVYYIVYHASI